MRPTQQAVYPLPYQLPQDSRYGHPPAFTLRFPGSAGGRSLLRSPPLDVRTVGDNKTLDPRLLDLPPSLPA
jgi:hypothetical protein